jgi:hypothetical protein
LIFVVPLIPLVAYADRRRILFHLPAKGVICNGRDVVLPLPFHFSSDVHYRCKRGLSVLPAELRGA